MALATAVASFPATGFLDGASVQALLVEHTSARSGPPGVAVALVTPRDVRFFPQGRADAKGTAVGPDTGFEIGSVTKTMTAYLAVDAAARGKLQLNEPLQYWHFTALAGAGGVRSTPRDMALYVQALLGSAAPWTEAFAKMREPRAPAGIPDTHVGLAWLTTQIGTRSIVGHNGMTGGFASMLAIDPATSEGVIVLANAAISMDELRLQVLGVIPTSAASP